MKNKNLTLEVLQELYNHFVTHLNNEITNYNNEYGTQLQLCNHITYKNVKMQFPELFLQIKSTNFEYEDFTKNCNLKIINDCYLSFAFKDNTENFQDNVERYCYILSKMLTDFENEKISYIILNSIERGELESKDLQTLKVIVINFKTITLT